MKLFEAIKTEFEEMYQFYRGTKYIPAPGDNRAVGKLISRIKDEVKAESPAINLDKGLKSKSIPPPIPLYEGEIDPLPAKAVLPLGKGESRCDIEDEAEVLKESEIIFSRVQKIFRSVFMYAPGWVKKNYQGKDGKWRTITIQLINSEYEMIRSNWYEKWNEAENYDKKGHKKVNNAKKTQIEKTMGMSIEQLLSEIIPKEMTAGASGGT
jgi:hypothetical protein